MSYKSMSEETRKAVLEVLFWETINVIRQLGKRIKEKDFSEENLGPAFCHYTIPGYGAIQHYFKKDDKFIYLLSNDEVLRIDLDDILLGRLELFDRELLPLCEKGVVNRGFALLLL